MPQPSLQRRLLARRDAWPDRDALAFFGRDASAERSWLTWETLSDRVSRRAGALAAAGLQAGETALILLPTGQPCAEILLAVLQLGGLPLLVAEPAMKRLDRPWIDGLRATAATSETRLVVCRRWLLDDLRLDRRTLACEDAIGEPHDRWVVPDDATSPGALQLTSGTTGRPRICVWRQDRLLAALDGMHAAMSLGADDRCCNWTPLYHDMGLVNNFLLCLTAGVPLVMLDPLQFVVEPAGWLRTLGEDRSTITWAPNFGYALAAERVRDEELGDVRLDSLRACWNAAERIHAATYERFYRRFAGLGLRREALKANFGCAENVGGATFSRHGYLVEQVDAARLHTDGVAQPVGPDFPGEVESFVGCGVPCPGLTVRIVDGDGRSLPDGEVGEIVLETPSAFSGYMGDPVSTARALPRAGDVRTGDLGYRRADELFWTGRTDERLTIRGRKFDPSDFEAPLLEIDGLRPGCFVAFDVTVEAEGTQAAVIVAELRKPPRPGTASVRGEIRLRITRDLGVPVADVLLVEPGSLDKTTSGKRRHLYYKELYRTRGAEGFTTCLASDG